MIRLYQPTSSVRPGRTTQPIRSVYLRISVNDRCNLRCLYCRPAGDRVSGPSLNLRRDDRQLSIDEYLDLIAAIRAVCPIHKVRITGGEPLLNHDVPDLIAAIKNKFPGIQTALTTNGLLLSRYAEALQRAGLDRLNISLDAIDQDMFEAMGRGGKVANVVDGVLRAQSLGFVGTRFNTVLMKSFNSDQLTRLVGFAAEVKCEIRFIELMPIGEGAAFFEDNYITAAEVLKILKQEFQVLESLPDSATAQRYRLAGAGGQVDVGFITTTSDPFCDRCDRLRLNHRGELYSCIKATRGADLLTPLRQLEPEEVGIRIAQTLQQKSQAIVPWPSRNMVHIGG